MLAFNCGYASFTIISALEMTMNGIPGSTEIIGPELRNWWCVPL